MNAKASKEEKKAKEPEKKKEGGQVKALDVMDLVQFMARPLKEMEIKIRDGFEEFQSRLDDIQKHRVDFKEAMDLVSKEVDALQKMVNQANVGMQKAQNMAHPVPDLSHRLSELEKEQKRLEKELKELPELADAFRLFRKDFDYQCKVFKRLDKLIEDYGQQSKDVGDRHKEKLKDHELRFKAFRKEIADIKAENDMDMSDLRQEVDRRLNAMNKSLESFHSEANHMNARNVEMLKEHRAKINDRLDQTADDSRKVVDDVKQNIAQFKDMCEMVDLIKKEIHLQERRIDKAVSVIKELKFQFGEI